MIIWIFWNTYIFFVTVITLSIGTWENILDPERMPQNAAYDHGLQCLSLSLAGFCHTEKVVKKSKRKVQREPQLQTAAHPRQKEEEETGKTKQAQIEQRYKKH